MSTRAMYTFLDENSEYHVYKHHDGYPSGAIEWIERAQFFAWALPRFEADEFAAAFVAANKWHHLHGILEPIVPKALERDGSDWADKMQTVEVPIPARHSVTAIGGGIRLMRSGPWRDVAPGDIEYRYVIEARGSHLWVTAHGVDCNWETGGWTSRELFSERLVDLIDMQDDVLDGLGIQAA